MSMHARRWIARTNRAEKLCLEFKAVAVDSAILGLSFGEAMIAFRGAAVERQETIKTMLDGAASDQAQRDERSLRRQGLQLPPGVKRRMPKR